MPTCTTCGNDYDKAFTVTTAGGNSFVFDSIECAAQQLAPTCDNCGVRILGHGLEANGTFYCCDHCAEKAGVTGLTDRV
jgi:DNA-directed RNA polymerase subunit RPC12/RpoP